MKCNMSIIKRTEENFFDVCDVLEKTITRDNLRDKGGTLNYSHLTYHTDFIILAFDGKKIVGYNAITIEDQGLYVYQIAVKKGYHNQRVGSQMLEVLIETAKKMNLDVLAHVRDYNTASQQLFLTHGFIKDEEESTPENGFYVLKCKKRVMA